MDVAKEGQLIRRLQTKASLNSKKKKTRLIEEIQVRFERLPVIWETYDQMQIEL
jgi:hypothetical protein